MQKSRFDQRKSAQGYVAPGERPGCRNCRHRSAKTAAIASAAGSVYDCRLGGFLVAAGGICLQHQPAGIASMWRKDEP